MITNPFHYGRIVEGGAFCNRTKELAELDRACRNCNSIFLYSERRLGKTSLVSKVLGNLPKDEFVTVYIDLWPTYGEDSFTLTVAKAIAEAGGQGVENLMEVSKSLFSRLLPTISMDQDGKPTVTFGLASRKIDLPALEEVIDSPSRLANRLNKKCVVVFDEFQQILQYDEDIVERRLRSIIQHHTNVAYMFLGSQKHLIQGLFTNNSRPLYRAATHFPLEAIAIEHWIPFIAIRFGNANKFITKDLIRLICEKTEGHPFYTQQLCHLLWEMTETNERVTKETIDVAIESLLDRESYGFTTQLDGLSSNQRRLLEAIAREGVQAQPYASDFISRTGFKSPSALQSAMKALTERDMVDRTEEGAYMISDRFLRLWLLRRIKAQ